MTETEALKRCHDFRGTKAEAEALADELNVAMAERTMVAVDFGDLGWGVMLVRAYIALKLMGKGTREP